MTDTNNLNEKNLEAMEEQLKKEAFSSDNELYSNEQNEEDSNQEEIKENEEAGENEVVEYFLPTLEHKIIDSVLSSKNFFLNHLTKKIPDSENLSQLRNKLAVFDEYKDAIANENLRSNIYSDKLLFRNKQPEKISKEQLDLLKNPLMINSEQQLKEKSLLNKKIARENNGSDIIITNELNNSTTASNANLFKAPINKSNNVNNLNDLKQPFLNASNALALKSDEQEKSALAAIPEKFKKKELINTANNESLLNLNLDTESGKDSNLFLSLYRNKNHIAFRKNKLVTPEWHAPWKLYRVISGHNGWVRCIDVDPTNNWFVTGSNDRVIKFWDLASGKLKLSLTGHINTVRAVVVSNRHPYLFSAGEDKQVKCWDLEQNKVVRHYHGHLSGVHTLTLHPTIDVIITGGRDCVARVWDIRSKQQIMCLEGHNNTVSTVVSQEHNPQVITGSHDSTIKLWDLGSGKCMNTLTHHKKSIRSILLHESDYSFVSGGCDDIKVWQCPEGRYLRNMTGHNSIINSIALNKDNVLVSGGDEGSLYFWDYKSGYNFQKIQTTVQPGSLSSEAGIFSIKFDHSSTRMITAECDKTIKMWREDESATPESHPIDF